MKTLNCRRCGGTGELPVNVRPFGMVERTIIVPCHRCQGFGVEACSFCGAGAVQEYEGELYCETCWLAQSADLASQA